MSEQTATTVVKLRDQIDYKLLSHPIIRDHIKGELNEISDLLRDRFDSRLRRQYGKVNVCGLEMDAPEALWKCSEAAYNDRLKYYIEGGMSAGEVILVDQMLLSSQDVLDWFEDNEDFIRSIRKEVYRQEHEDE